MKCKSKMLEKEIEHRMCKLVREHGGLIYKFVGLENGLPDRIFILPGGDVWFVELKTKKGRLSKIQNYQISRLKKQGANVRTVYGYDDVVKFIEEVMGDG